MNPIRKDMELLSNSMATYAHITENMESFALYFMLGVCSGLLLALVLLILGIACRPSSKTKTKTKTKTPSSPDKKRLKESSEEEEEDKEEDQSEEGDDEDLEVPVVTVSPMSDQTQLNGTIKSVNVFASAEELERARRLEERERIVREIWRNGQPDILVTGTGTLGRVHYH
ncbi:eva-1 -like protein [Labeo rohita]|uniref:Eva-1-like protein n=1 Tax=Labeo rohita TaxID=84645 RepID=A0A498LW28_LABRO|nr:eva-1 homolog Bb [Labeo rohita]RXN09545.1 eva-1 -like protein [Labeo rohita]RXN19161.1 eva-1 -like protein [Labeo rohita]